MNMENETLLLFSKDYYRLSSSTPTLLPSTHSAHGFIHQCIASLQWKWLFMVIIAWELRRMFWVLGYRAPRNVMLIGYPTPVGAYITAILNMFSIESILEEGYRQANGQPYAIPTIGRWIVCASSPKQIEEINRSSIYTVSLRGAIFDRIFPTQTMSGIKFHDQDEKGTVSRYLFKNKLRERLPTFSPTFYNIIMSSLQNDLSISKIEGNSKTIWASSSMERLATRLNMHVILGPELASKPGMIDNVLAYVHDATLTEEILQFVPAMFVPTVGSALANWRQSGNKIMDDVEAAIISRLNSSSTKTKPHTDILQWTIDSSKHLDTRAIARLVLGYIFGAAHQMPMMLTFALYYLAAEKSYLPKLREEAAQATTMDYTGQNTEMPYLDSFLKETARLNTLMVFGAPRRCMADFSLSDGTFIPERNWLVIAQQPLMRDNALYPNGNQFQGFRFVNEDKIGDVKSTSRFSFPSSTFTFWGSVKQGCPARFYASMVMKMILANMILKYDIELDDPTARRTISFGIGRAPSPWLKVKLRERVQE